MDSQTSVSSRLRGLAPKCSFTVAETAEILGMSRTDLERLLTDSVLNGTSDSGTLDDLHLRVPDVVMLSLVGKPSPERNPFAY